MRISFRCFVCRTWLIAACFLGGAAVAQPVWTPIGPDGGAASAEVLVVSPSSPRTVYAGTLSGGVQVSRDGGRSWKPASWGLTRARIRTLAVDPRQAAVAYAATFGGDVFKTVDFGRRWSQMSLSSGNLVTSLLVDPRDPSRVYAGLHNGFQVSSDGGATWRSATTGLPQTGFYSALALAASPGEQALYLSLSGSSPGLYVSRNRGLSWRRLSDVAPRQLFVDPQSPSLLYGTDGRFFLQSRNGGATWQRRNLGVPAAGALHLAIGSGSPAPLFALRSDATVLTSTDRGSRWRVLGRLPAPAAAAVPPAVVGPRELLAVGSGTGILRSGDGGLNWAPSGRGFIHTSVFSLAFGPRSMLIAGTSDGLYTRADGGAWRQAVSGLYVHDVATTPAALDRIYATGLASLGSSTPPVWKSTDGGGSWQSAASGLAGYWGTDLAIDPDFPDVAYLAARALEGEGGRLFKTTDGGASWNPLAFPGLVADGVPLQVETTRPDAAAVYVSASGTGVWRSRDGGGSWERVLTGSLFTYYELAPSPTDSAKIFALQVNDHGQHRLLESADGGSAWQEIPTAPPVAWIERLTIDPQEPDTLFLLTGDRGLFRRRGQGDWEKLSEGFYNSHTSGVALDPLRPGRLLVGTLGAGIFETLAP